MKIGAWQVVLVAGADTNASSTIAPKTTVAMIVQTAFLFIRYPATFSSVALRTFQHPRLIYNRQYGFNNELYVSIAVAYSALLTIRFLSFP